MEYWVTFIDFLHNNILGKVIIGIVSSFSFIFLLLWLLRPRFTIADKICHKVDEDGKKYYFFKVVNLSIFPLYSVEIKLHERVPYIVDTQKINRQMNEKKLSTERIFSIPRRRKGRGEHAILIRTFDDLESNINVNNLDYRLTVSGKHGLSNITRVVSQSFSSDNCLYDGEFKFGSKTDVI